MYVVSFYFPIYFVNKKLTFDVFNPTSFYQQQVIYSFQSDCYSLLFFCSLLFQKLFYLTNNFALTENTTKITRRSPHGMHTHSFNLKYWQHETIQRNNKSRALTALTLLAPLLDWRNQSLPKTLNRVICVCELTPWKL